MAVPLSAGFIMKLVLSLREVNATHSSGVRWSGRFRGPVHLKTSNSRMKRSIISASTDGVAGDFGGHQPDGPWRLVSLSADGSWSLNDGYRWLKK